MQIEHLYYLQEVMDSGSFSMAAEKLYISQQRLSEIIAKLENEFQLKIFIRSKKGVRLTTDGKAFMEDIKKLLEQYEYLQRKYVLCKQNTTDLKIVINPIVSDLFLEKVLEVFRAKYPQIVLSVFEKENPFDVLKEVAESRADLAITSMPPAIYQNKTKFMNLSIEDLFLDQMCVFIAKSYPLADRKTITLEECLQQPLILDNNNLTRDYFLDYYIRKKHLSADYTVTMKVNGLTYLKMVTHGLGLGFILKFQAKKMNSPELLAVPIRDVDPFHFVFAYSNQFNRSQPVRQFQEIYLQTLENCTGLVDSPL